MIATKALSSSHNGIRRVVVTGIGAITPFGNDFQSTWKNLISSNVKETLNSSPETFEASETSLSSATTSIGITSLEDAMHLQNLPSQILNEEMELAMKLPSQVAAPVRGVEFCPRTGRFVQLALIAAEDALHNADLTKWLKIGQNDNNSDNESDNEDEELQHRLTRIGTCIASGMSSVREVAAAYSNIKSTQSLRRLSPHFVPKVLCNSASSRVSLQYKLQGPNLSPSTACAAGAHAIGEAMRCIQFGDADIMLAGGSEACIDPISMGGFVRLRALSTNFNDCPIDASRPFDRDRDGFVMGEGSAVLILEEMEHAKSRGASILCEVRGYGMSGDGHHVTSPDPNGKGAKRAMRMALDRAGINADSIDYVNAHATSTPMGDEIEERAIADVIKSSTTWRDRNVYVSSTKGATGHLLGAAGAIEGAFAAMTIHDGIVPPTRNLSDSTGSFQEFQHVIGTSIKDDIQVSVSNSFGFGGTNASIVFTSLDFKAQYT